MTTLEHCRILFDNDASTFAFRAGQLLQSLLLDRGLERTRSADSTIVTAEIVKACIDESLLAELKKGLDERSEREPRQVA